MMVEADAVLQNSEGSKQRSRRAGRVKKGETPADAGGASPASDAMSLGSVSTAPAVPPRKRRRGKRGGDGANRPKPGAPIEDIEAAAVVTNTVEPTRQRQEPERRSQPRRQPAPAQQKAGDKNEGRRRQQNAPSAAPEEGQKNKMSDEDMRAPEPAAVEPTTAGVTRDFAPRAEENKKDVMEMSVESYQTVSSKSILTNQKFDDNPTLCDPLKAALRDAGYFYMSQIQAFAIPKILAGRDVLGAAKTGSGKTLAFVLPALNLLYKVRATPRQGTLCLILGPTRELILQISEVVRAAGKNVQHTFGCVIGGSNRKEEERRLTTGVNMLAATPGRLLDHMRNSKSFQYSHLCMLVLDEADRMLDVGFERELNQILSMLPKERQTILFSATQTRKIAELVRLALRNPILVEIKDNESSTVEGLKQFYLMCESADRLALLYSILSIKSKKDIVCPKTGKTRRLKIMVFFSSCKSVQYHEELFRLAGGLGDQELYSLHGQKKQSKRLETYNKYCTQDCGILFCTNVAARGLDFPGVDYVVQYDPPDEIRDYIHRVGRTARGEAGEGSSLLFLLPHEMAFLQELNKLKAYPTRMSPNLKNLNVINEKLVEIIGNTPVIKKNAAVAFKKFLLAYNSHKFKQIFDFGKLDLAAVARGFGLPQMPKISLDVFGKKGRKKQQS